MLKEKQPTIQNKESKNPKEREPSIQDILASIRGIIEDKSPQSQTITKQDKSKDIKDNHITGKNDDSVLELTNIFLPENEDDSLISSNTKKSYISTIENFTDELAKIDPEITHSNIANSSESLDNIINKLIRPMLKEWLDNNLPRLVEKIVSEEIKQLMRKK